MYVRKPSACHDFEHTYMDLEHTYKHIVSQNFMFSEAFKHVCMFKILVFYRAKRSNINSKHIVSCFSLKHVCMFGKGVQNHVFCRAFCNSDSTVLNERHRFFKFSKRYRARYYINTSIHTSSNSMLFLLS